jgi:hypothetical protein
MTKETKELIKDLLKLLFIPITGLYYLIKECKDDDYQNFHTEWFAYILIVIAWCGCVAISSITIWGLIYHFDATIIPVSIVVGGIFVFSILPVIIHKLIHKK